MLFRSTIKFLDTGNAAIDGANELGSFNLTVTKLSQLPQLNQYFTFDGLFLGATSSLHQIVNIQYIDNETLLLTLDQELEANVPDDVRFTLGSLSEFPPGLDFNQNNNEIFGYMPYQPAVTKTYKFTLQAIKYSLSTTEIARSYRTFVFNAIGEIESLITWVSDYNLGSIPANFISNFKVYAKPYTPTNVVVYQLVSGRLPPGLTLGAGGEKIGRAHV